MKDPESDGGNRSLGPLLGFLGMILALEMTRTSPRARAEPCSGIGEWRDCLGPLPAVGAEAELGGLGRRGVEAIPPEGPGA